MSDMSAKLDLLKIGRTAPASAAPAAAGRAGRVLLVACAVLGLGAAGAALVQHRVPAWSGVAAHGTAQAAPPPVPVAAAPAAAAQVLVASGYVVARRRATVAAEVTGRLLDIRVEEGQRVAPGQVLAVLDAGIADSELASARARAASAAAGTRAAVADLAEGRDTAQRSDTLAQTGFLSKTSLVKDHARVANLEAQLGRAEAEAVAARADAARLQAQRRQYDIRAPFAGVVVDKNAQPGEIVSPISGAGGFTRSGICTIVDMASLEIQAEVSENYIGRVQPGQQVDAMLEAYPGLAIPARVLAVVPTANRDKGTVRVRIGLLHPEPKILPDMAVKVTIHATSPKGN